MMIHAEGDAKSNRSRERTEIVAKIVPRPDNLGLSTWYTQGGIADANTSQLRSVSKWVNLRQSVSSIPAETSDQLKWNKDQPLFSERLDRIFLSFSMYMSSRVFFSSFLFKPVRGIKCRSRKTRNLRDRWTEISASKSANKRHGVGG